MRNNEGVLAPHGLGGDNSLKRKTTAAPRQPPPLIPEEDRRRSSRVSNQVVTFQALSHEFCDEEERRAERSGGTRKRSAPLSFQEEQAREVAAREAKAAERRREQAERAKMAAMAAMAQQQLLRRVVMVQAAPLVADLPIVDDNDDNVQRPAYGPHTSFLTRPCPSAPAALTALASL